MANTPKNKTPEKIQFPLDSRKLSAAQDAHNSWIKKTRSGHVIEINDNAGAEHITIQHRAGTMLQFQPDGTLYIAASNGFYQLVFGENRLYMTGSYDIVVDGDASLKVGGDYNVTIRGDYNLAVDGDHNTVIGGAKTKTIVGNETDIIGGRQKINVKESVEYQSKGKLVMASADDLRMLTDGTWQLETTEGIALKSAGFITADSETGVSIG